MSNKNNVEYCQQFDDCKGCPEGEKDFCTGIKEQMKARRKRKRKKKKK